MILTELIDVALNTLRVGVGVQTDCLLGLLEKVGQLAEGLLKQLVSGPPLPTTRRLWLMKYEGYGKRQMLRISRLNFHGDGGLPWVLPDFFNGYICHTCASKDAEKDISRTSIGCLYSLIVSFLCVVGRLVCGFQRLQKTSPKLPAERTLHAAEGCPMTAPVRGSISAAARIPPAAAAMTTKRAPKPQPAWIPATTGSAEAATEKVTM